MSRNLATNCGSLDSLYRRIRWGCRPWARQMRWTELTLIPTALAMAAPVQWVACAGGRAKVKATTRSAISGLNGGMRDGRVLSRHSPAAPSEPNRSCQRQMTVLAFPVRRMISAVPCPAAVSRTIWARPPDMLLRAVPVGDNCLQRGSVGGAQFDLGSFVHSPDSHDRVCRGIRKRIEKSDLVH